MPTPIPSVRLVPPWQASAPLDSDAFLNRRNLRIGMTFRHNAPIPNPMLGIQFPLGQSLSLLPYLSGNAVDAFLAFTLRPNVQFYNDSRLKLSLFAEMGIGHFFYGVRGPSSPGGFQFDVGLGVEACLRLIYQHGLCASIGYTNAWNERTITHSLASSRMEGWDARSLLNLGVAVAFGL